MMRPRWHQSTQNWTPKHRFVLWRLGALIGFMWLLFMIALMIIAVIFFDLPHPPVQNPRRFMWAFCLVPLVFFFLVTFIGGLGMRRIGTPIANVMSAADSVAKGDLDVRVPEMVPGEFGKLARSFNRMTVELQRAEQQRRNMAADIAHELRNPLHIIQGNLEGILDGVYEPTPENVSVILDETRLLNRLVSDLQTLSLAEAGQLPLHPVHFLALDLLSDVVTSFSGQAAEQGVDLSVDVAGAGDIDQLEIYADPDRLDQVLSNLVANALHYTSQGGRITLSAAPGSGYVRLSVQDTGAGIPAEDLPYVFDRFWRGDRSRTRSGGTGSGLGLAIARQLVQAHGGVIQVTSQPSQGARFTIEIPVL